MVAIVAAVTSQQATRQRSRSQGGTFSWPLAERHKAATEGDRQVPHQPSAPCRPVAGREMAPVPRQLHVPLPTFDFHHQFVDRHPSAPAGPHGDPGASRADLVNSSITIAPAGRATNRADHPCFVSRPPIFSLHRPARGEASLAPPVGRPSGSRYAAPRIRRASSRSASCCEVGPAATRAVPAGDAAQNRSTRVPETRKLVAASLAHVSGVTR